MTVVARDCRAPTAANTVKYFFLRPRSLNLHLRGRIRLRSRAERRDGDAAEDNRRYARRVLYLIRNPNNFPVAARSRQALEHPRLVLFYVCMAVGRNPCFWVANDIVAERKRDAKSFRFTRVESSRGEKNYDSRRRNVRTAVVVSFLSSCVLARESVVNTLSYYFIASRPTSRTQTAVLWRTSSSHPARDMFRNCFRG